MIVVRDPISVTLTMSEAYTASILGVMRNLSSTFKGKVNRLGNGNNFQIHIEGACGEMAFAKALNTYNPMTLNTYKEGADIGKLVQVRTRSEPHYDLIVREDDADDHAFVLVTGQCPYYIIHGWILGGDAKRDEYLNNYGGHGTAWFVPQVALLSLNTLPKEML